MTLGHLRIGFVGLLGLGYVYMFASAIGERSWFPVGQLLGWTVPMLVFRIGAQWATDKSEALAHWPWTRVLWPAGIFGFITLVGQLFGAVPDRNPVVTAFFQGLLLMITSVAMTLLNINTMRAIPDVEEDKPVAPT